MTQDCQIDRQILLTGQYRISPDRIFKQGPDDDSATLAAIRATYDHLRGDKSWQEWSREHGPTAPLSYQI